MAFCNSCGATLDAGTKFCNKCGAVVPVANTSALATPAAPGAAAPKQGSSSVKIILIIVAVIVGMGIIGISIVSYIGYRIAKSAHVTQKNGQVKVDSPFGNIETSSDPADAAKNLGVDIYPGAEIQKNGAVSMTIMGMHTSTAIMQTSDAASQVAEFYRGKLPNANFAGQGENYSLHSGDRNDMTSIGIQGDGGGSTKITITRVTKVNN